MLSYHNEQESHGTCSAMQASVPPPIGGQEVSCGHAHQTFPRRFGEYAAHTYFAASHSSRSDCHSLCPDTNVVANLSLSSAARLQLPQSLLRAILYHARSLLQQLPQACRHLLQRGYCVLRHFLPSPCCLAQYSPRKTHLAHSGIGRLPFEIYTAKVGTIGNESRPNFVEQPAIRPSLKSAMNGTVVGKIFGQLVPLTAAAHAKDYRIQSGSLVDSTAPGMFGRVEFPDNWFYGVPQFFRHMPNRWQRLYFTFFSHLCILSINLHRCYRLNYAF
jgi:hypothetical protein